MGTNGPIWIVDLDGGADPEALEGPLDVVGAGAKRSTNMFSTGKGAVPSTQAEGGTAAEARDLEKVAHPRSGRESRPCGGARQPACCTRTACRGSTCALRRCVRPGNAPARPGWTCRRRGGATRSGLA